MSEKLIFYKNTFKRCAMAAQKIDKDQCILEEIIQDKRNEFNENIQELSQYKEIADNASQFYCKLFCEEMEKEDTSMFVVEVHWTQSCEKTYESVWKNENEAKKEAEKFWDDCYGSVKVLRLSEIPDYKKLLEKLARKELNKF